MHDLAHHIIDTIDTKRIARGYRNFKHYRLRLLLNHGRIHEDHTPARISTRRPSFVA